MFSKSSKSSDWFFWERPDHDFPLYNDIRIETWQAVALLATPAVVFAALRFLNPSRAVKAACWFLGTFIPFLVVARGNVGAIIKRPRLGDIPLIIVTLILTIAWSIGMAVFLYAAVGVQIQGTAVATEQFGSNAYLWIAVQLFGEEMFKLDIFFCVLILLYRRLGNRKTSVIIATLVTMVIFGLAHITAYNGAILQILLIQGLGSIFDLFCYLRTKNVLPAYAMHLLFDFMFLS